MVIDDHRRILRVVAGDMEAAFLEGAEYARELASASLPEPADVVLTTGAGYPLDATYYQAIKGMVAAMDVVKPGGTIILAAEMSEGIGSPYFQKLFRAHTSLQQFVEAIERPGYFAAEQWQLEEYAKVRQRAKIKVVSGGLSAETLRRLFVEPAADVPSAVAESLAEYGPQATLAVIPKGPYVLAAVKPIT